MKKKIIIPVIVIIILLIAVLVYMQKPTEPSIPVETPVPTETPMPTETPIPTEEPTPTKTPSDTSGKYEVSPGVYSDGTVRKPSTEEWETYTDEEKEIWREAYAKANGFGSSLDELDGVTAEETKDFMDETWNVDNPYIKDIIDSGVLNN